MWLGVSALLPIISGWRDLAARFPAIHPVEGERFLFASGAIGASTVFPVGYRSCLFFTIGNTGFRVSVFFPFRLLSPPLSIPWAQVESVTEQQIWRSNYTVVSIRGFSTKIMARGQVGQSISNSYAQFSSQPER